MQYSLPYILFIGFILLVAICQLALPIDEKSRRCLNYLLVVGYVLFFGFRGFIGWDWYNYYPFFQRLNSFHYGGYEQGFVIYSFIIKSIFHTYQSYILISTIIDIYLLNLFLKRHVNEKYYAFALAIFIAFAGIILQTDLLRNIKSILLFMISIKYIEERKLIPFLILNILGIFFHWTSLFLIPLYFIFQKPLPLKFIIIAFILGNCIILLNIHYIKPILLYLSKLVGGSVDAKITFYIANKIFSKPYEISYGYFIRQFTTLLVMFYYNKIINKSSSTIFFLNAFFLLMGVYLYFSEISIAIARLNLIFNFSLTIMIIILLEVIVPLSTRLLLFIIYSLLIIIRMNSSTNNVLYKYDNTLFGQTQSYNERFATYNLNHLKLVNEK
jgi:hypothetical protein